MIKIEWLESYFRMKNRVMDKLEDIGSTPVSKEIESQLVNIEPRVITALEKIVEDASNEMRRLRQILEESERGGSND